MNWGYGSNRIQKLKVSFTSKDVEITEKRTSENIQKIFRRTGKLVWHLPLTNVAETLKHNIFRENFPFEFYCYIPLSRSSVKQRDIWSQSGQVPRPFQHNVHGSKCKIHFCLPEHWHCVMFFPTLFFQQYWHNMLLLFLHLEVFLACTSVIYRKGESAYKSKPNLNQTFLLSCRHLLFACVSCSFYYGPHSRNCLW